MPTLSLESFADEIMNCLKEMVSQNVNLTILRETKPNVPNAISIVFNDKSNIVPTILINQYYQEDYLKNNRSIKDIASDIKEAYECNQKTPINISADKISNYDFVKVRSYIKLLNFEKNEEYLKDKVYDRVEDLAAIYCVFVQSRTKGIGSIPVTNDYLKTLNVSKEQFKEDALANMKNSVLMKTMQEILFEEMGVHVSGPEENMYILTNTNMLNGAGQILVPEASDKLLSLGKGDEFIVFPSSIHELILLPSCDYKYESIYDLQSIVMSANEQAVSNADFLSNSVYMYNARTKEFSLAEEKEKEEDQELE